MCNRNCKDCRTYWCKRDEIWVCTGICESRKKIGRCGKTCVTLNPTIRKTAAERLVNKQKRKAKVKANEV